MNRFTHVMESGLELCVVIKHAAQFQQFRTLVPISAALLQRVNRAMIDTMHHRCSIMVAVAQCSASTYHDQMRECDGPLFIVPQDGKNMAYLLAAKFHA